MQNIPKLEHKSSSLAKGYDSGPPHSRGKGDPNRNPWLAKMNISIPADIKND
jgi:hypothetical protein